jgi:hypothetical protein
MSRISTNDDASKYFFPLVATRRHDHRGHCFGGRCHRLSSDHG